MKPTVQGKLDSCGLIFCTLADSCDLIFCILSTLICDFCRIMKPTVQGYLDLCELIFCTMAVWKCDFCRVVKQTVQAYLFSSDVIFSILRAWIFDFCRVVKLTVQGYRASCELFFLQFGGLKMRFLPIMWLQVRHRHLVPWKYHSDMFWDLGLSEIHLSNYSTSMRYLASTKPLFGLLEAWKWDSSRFMRLLVEEYMASVEQLCVILTATKSGSCRVVRCQQLFDILAT